MKPCDIKVGDVLTPLAIWNKTERPTNRLPATCEVLDVDHEAYSQTRTVVKVTNVRGAPDWLDSAWFEEVEE